MLTQYANKRVHIHTLFRGTEINRHTIPGSPHFLYCNNERLGRDVRTKLNRYTDIKSKAPLFLPGRQLGQASYPYLVAGATESTAYTQTISESTLILMTVK